MTFYWEDEPDYVETEEHKAWAEKLDAWDKMVGFS